MSICVCRLFPTRDGSRSNYHAQPLQKHEIKVSTCILVAYYQETDYNILQLLKVSMLRALVAHLTVVYNFLLCLTLVMKFNNTDSWYAM